MTSPHSSRGNVPATLDALVANTALAHPERPAVCDGEHTYSYAQLLGAAASVARFLDEVGIGRGDRVGLGLPKSAAAVACILGILKAKAAYVPLDLESPAQRSATILANCGAAAVISKPDHQTALLPNSSSSRPPLPLEVLSQECRFIGLVDRDQRISSPPETSYILHTSGSTGVPKGVVHSHSSALAFVTHSLETFSPQPEDRFASLAAFHFDLSIFDIFVALASGASLLLFDSTRLRSPRGLAEEIRSRPPSIWYSTPTLLRLLIEYADLGKGAIPSPRIVCFAGEVFPIRPLEVLRSAWPEARFFNLYGPTETNVCTLWPLPSESTTPLPDPLPIGRPFSGDRCRILGHDSDRAEGELVVSGPSLMTGYWSSPDFSRPFIEIEGESWYRTGDIVRETSEGYVFLGREDRMVKRNGYRIELGEIEAALERLPKVRAAAAVATKSGDQTLSIKAFVVPRQELTIVELKAHCAVELPPTMIPDRIFRLTELPTTSTGKIDYQRLEIEGSRE